MLLLPLLLFVTALLPASSTEPPDVELSLLVSGVDALPPHTTAALRKELASLLELPRIALQWREIADDPPEEVFQRIVVVRLRNAPAALPGSESASSLGATHVTDGEILPFVDVYCDRVNAFVGPLLDRESPHRRPDLLGRAIARVLAHELYHALTRSLHHGTRGLMQPWLTPKDLVEGRIEFDPAEKGELFWCLHGGELTRAATGPGRAGRDARPGEPARSGSPEF